MRKKALLFPLVLLAALLAAFLSPPASCLAESELLRNGEMALSEGSAFPAYWTPDDWKGDGSTYYGALRRDGYDCCVIENAEENDARFLQEIEVEPGAVYRFTCLALAEGCSGGRGANLSVENTYAYSECLFDTAGEWETLTLYAKAGEGTRSLTLYLRLGGYSGLTRGKAYFTAASAQRVDSVPEGEEVYTVAFSSGSSSDSAADDTGVPARYTPHWLLLGCLFLIGFAAAANRGRSSSGGTGISFALFALVALALRLALAYAVRGHYYDINCFLGWSERIASTGPMEFYSADSFCDYPPLYILVLALPAKLRALLGIGAYTPAHVLLVKLIPILCDVLSACLVYSHAKRRIGGRGALLLSLAVLFCPALIADSSAWGQIDSVFTLALVLAALLLSKGLALPALPLFAAAMLIKPQALLYAPLGLAFALWDVIYRWHWKKLVFLIAGTVSSLLLIYGVFLWFGGAEHVMDPAARAVALYSGTMSGYDYVVLNTLNAYEAFSLNWRPMAQVPLVGVFSWAMFANAYLFAGALLLCRPSKKPRLFLAASALTAVIWCFGPMMHERYIYPALLLLLFAYLQDRDRRLLLCQALYAFLLFMNEMLVLQGGLTQSNYGHLQASENWLNIPLSLLNVALTCYLCWTAFDIAFRGRVKPLSRPAPPVPFLRAPKRPARSSSETAAVAAVTVLYAVFAFFNLGTLSFPQTAWTSAKPGDTVTFDLGEVRTFYMEYCGGICDTAFTCEFSRDGATWSDAWYARYDQGEIFRWLRFVPLDSAFEPARGADGLVRFASGSYDTPMQTARYVRIASSGSGLKLLEVGFTDESGAAFPIASVTGSDGCAALADEQDTVPASPSWYNSTYFDEIYHARTAYEHLHGIHAYEWTHPPLGKVLMMAGIAIFGMCPFGWRFMGCLAGVLMLPAMYAAAREITRSRRASFLAMALLALDSMHFTQTRIATIDSYAVLFILLEYLFMFRFRSCVREGAGMGRRLALLAASGTAMGCACAVKWIGLYSGIGLAVLFFTSLYREAKERPAPLGKVLERDALLCLWCLAFFVAVPCLIYYCSYWWQLAPDGGLTLERVWQTQKGMLSYHAGLGGDDHYFRSEWYEWPVIYKPMWYYSGRGVVPQDTVSSISCMGNPCVWWCGLAALLYQAVRYAFSRRPRFGAAVCLAAFASQYLPWVLVPRSTFIYHYFASVPFLIILLALTAEEFRRRHPAAGTALYAALYSASAALFLMFYPLESGVSCPRSYAKWLRWFNWYNY